VVHPRFRCFAPAGAPSSSAVVYPLTAKQDKKGSSGPGSPVADACFFSLSQAIVKGYLVIFRFPKKKSTPLTENKLLENTIITYFNLGQSSFFLKRRRTKIQTENLILQNFT
jgi:hypothetical protein